MARKTKTPSGPDRRRLAGPAAAPAHKPQIALRSIDGHLTRTGDSVYAWYRLAPQRWSFRSDSQREQLINAIAGQYGELQGRWMHLRVTNRPFPIKDWARAHVRNSFNRLPDTNVEGALSFDDYMIGEQQRLLGRSMSDKEVYLGIEVQTRTAVDRLVERAAPLVRRLFPEAMDAELVALDGEIDRLDQLVSSAGLEGTPVTADEMWWLMYRSCTLGLPAPLAEPATGEGRWELEDLDSFPEAASWHADPYSPTLTVTGRTAGNAGVERHVAVLTVGLMQDLRIPEQGEPWAQIADRLHAAVEWSARIYVRRPDEVSNELHRGVGKIKSQLRHYTREHDVDAPMSLERQAMQARHIEDEMASGFQVQHTRVKSWWRAAVSGNTSQEALRLGQALMDLYKPQIALEHPEAQYALAREFIPGEPLSSSAYMRRGNVQWAAAAMPTATSEVGDKRGILLGETSTSTRRPVAWDPWMAQEMRDQSGLTAVVAGLGAGKSFLGGSIVYKTLRSGAHWTLLDPSGPLAALCELPELRPYARVINLLQAEPGILNPYRVVAEPVRADFDSEKDFITEKKHTEASRRRLVLDVLMGLMPHSIAQIAESKIVLLQAVRAVGGRFDAHPGMVIDKLKDDQTEHRSHAKAVYNFLDEMRDRMTLLIPERGDDPYARVRDDRLTVLTMAGLTLPKDGIGREHWTDTEALGIELLNLAAWLTQRSVYEGPAGYERTTGTRWKDARKGVWIDEAFFLSEVPTGRVLMNRFARDSRKWNVRVLLSSQIPADFLRIQGFVALLDSVFVGRLDDDAAQADALRLLKVPVGTGYEEVVAGLGKRPGAHRGGRDRTPRSFIFADGTGGVERIKVDVSGDHLAGLRAALDTTPGETLATPGQVATSDDEPESAAVQPGVLEPELAELDDEPNPALALAAASARAARVVGADQSERNSHGEGVA
ncbi:ATP-binding protein [Lentzea sp. NBRC 102530]|uniref:ATP-binding protein n=1 Tax=Lentzea sp. NBRC 102530 TaxID=3032201 RepID=UPI0024A1B6D8|nr:ATP-binding protein [Lentzea sp. NBRC 102530]GLY54835.1 ATPase [Lentzea sp. NBRC 102530]